MLSSIDIVNYRSLRGLRVSKLKKFNLITGRNGGGKTSLLEAIFLNGGAGNANNLFAVATFRGDDIFSTGSDLQFRSFFPDLDPANVVQIDSFQEIRKSKKSRTLRIEAISRVQPIAGRSIGEEFISGLRFRFSGPTEDNFIASVEMNQQPITPGPMGNVMASPPFTINTQTNKDLIYAYFISPYKRDAMQELHDNIASLTKERRIPALVEALTVIEPSIRDIVPLMEGGQPVIYIDIDRPKMMPISNLGSGFLHILRILVAIESTKSGIIIIDEIEDGLHYSIMPKIILMLLHASRNTDLQFFVSSHSNEIIRIFAESLEAEPRTDACLINLISERGKVTHRYFDSSEVVFANDLGAELR